MRCPLVIGSAFFSSAAARGAGSRVAPTAARTRTMADHWDTVRIRASMERVPLSERTFLRLGDGGAREVIQRSHEAAKDILRQRHGFPALAAEAHVLS